jgi:N-acetylglucosaminyl-diphospho-decaprenol L-rhamnosyltransferase
MVSGDPRVAVVMITYNRRDEVLASLGRLTRLPERPRIVVVDNGSRDDTVGAVRRRFPQVDVHPAGGNLGAAGRTIGVELVQAPYVAFCDDDTWWEPGSLGRAADLFDKHPRLASVTARVLVGPEEEEDPICAELLHSPLPVEPGMPGPPLLGFLAGASVIRRSAFLAAGGFEPRFFIGGEEELLALDLAAAGWWLCYLPQLTVHHYPSHRRDAGCRRWHVIRNALWCAWMRRRLPGALRKTWQVFRDAPWDRRTWQGFAAAVAGLLWVFRRRRAVPVEVESACCLLEQARNGSCRTG